MDLRNPNLRGAGTTHVAHHGAPSLRGGPDRLGRDEGKQSLQQPEHGGPARCFSGHLDTDIDDECSLGTPQPFRGVEPQCPGDGGLGWLYGRLALSDQHGGTVQPGHRLLDTHAYRRCTHGSRTASGHRDWRGGCPHDRLGRKRLGLQLPDGRWLLRRLFDLLTEPPIEPRDGR